MSNTAIALGPFSIYTMGLLMVFCYLWGAFVFYKVSAESHVDDNIILDAVVLSGFWGFIFSRFLFVVLNLSIFVKDWSRIFLMGTYPGLDRWGFLLGVFLGVTVIVKKLKQKYFDWYDCLSLGFMAGSSLYWVGLSLMYFSWQYVIIGLFSLAGFVWFWHLEKRYRLIEWYRAGKSFARTGFLAGFGLVFVGLSYLLELVIFSRTSLGGTFLVTFFILSGLTVVYIRSGRILVDDIKLLNIWKKKIKK